GVEKNTVDIIATELQLLGGREGGGGLGGGDEGGAQAPRAAAPRAAAQAQAPGQSPKGKTGFDDMDDDIPF
ncbi:MAG: hypothetical protein RJB64_705, partial [Pseudomonadota bacterium]